MKKDLILASRNKHKQKEIQSILTEYHILTLDDIDFFDEIEEDGKTFEENALIKARKIANLTGKKVISDDSGLCVDLLNNEPGIYSARYSKEGTDEANLQKVLQKLNGQKSNAKYVAVIAYIDENKIEKTFLGECKGIIINEKIGNNGFGYDPIFFVESINKTFAECTEDEKNNISHRKIALDKLKAYLELNDNENLYQ